MSTHICIYHKDCSDGTSSAAVFLKKFPDAKIFPLDHGYTQEEAEHILSQIPHNSVVYTLDCALLVRELLDQGNEVITLDHHISVQENMKTLAASEPRFTYFFRNDLSGATLAWNYFFPNQVVPYWLTLVQDKDLWTNLFPESDLLVNWTYTQRNKPENLLTLFEDEAFVTKALEAGKIIDGLNREYVDSFKKKAKPLLMQYEKYLIPVYNSTYLQSILGNVLADPDLGVTIIFSIRGSDIYMSVRSVTDSKVSALEVAQSFGGGGHRNAAGCKITFEEFITQVRTR